MIWKLGILLNYYQGFLKLVLVLSYLIKVRSYDEISHPNGLR